MEAAAPVLESWPRRRWLALTGWLLVAQLVLIFIFSSRSAFSIRQENAPTHVQLALDASLSPSEQILTTSDPTLFALIHPRSFSRSGWLDFSLMAHRLNDWQEPPLWLQPDPGQFGARFNTLIATSRLDRLQIEEKPRAQVTRLELPLDKPPPVSRLSIEGELLQRRLLSPITLPAWPSSDLLNPSVVQVMVDAAGDTLSARLIGASGSRQADQRAVELALEFRYDPLPAQSPDRLQSLSWGLLQFRWFTTELPPATNNPARLAP